MKDQHERRDDDEHRSSNEIVKHADLPRVAGQNLAGQPRSERGRWARRDARGSSESRGGLTTPRFVCRPALETLVSDVRRKELSAVCQQRGGPRAENLKAGGEEHSRSPRGRSRSDQLSRGDGELPPSQRSWSISCVSASISSEETSSFGARNAMWNGADPSFRTCDATWSSSRAKLASTAGLPERTAIQAAVAAI